MRDTAWWNETSCPTTACPRVSNFKPSGNNQRQLTRISSPSFCRVANRQPVAQLHGAVAEIANQAADKVAVAGRRGVAKRRLEFTQGRVHHVLQRSSSKIQT